MPIATVNPATAETVQVFDEHTPAEVERRIARSAAAHARLRRIGFDRRAELMRAAADLLDGESDAVAATMTLEMGKTLGSAREEIAKSSAGMRYYAENAERFMAPEPVEPAPAGAARAYRRWEPIGPVLAVMPWNFPLWQAIRFAAPALMAGNTGLLKHASNVPRTALYLGSLFDRAGFPDGAFQTLLVEAGLVERVIADERIRAVTLTGSEGAGRAVAAVAGRHLKKTVLELGGSDPFIVMPSADVAAAARTAAASRCQNNGQSCIAAKRFIVHHDAYEEFLDAFVQAMSALVVDDPLAASTDVGPLATERGRAELVELVADATAKGATVRCGGARPDRPGWWYPPTVLTDVGPSMRLYGEEAFGPVAAVHRVADYTEAVSLANGTGTRRPLSRFDTGRTCELGTQTCGSSICTSPPGLLPDLTVRSAGRPQRGPWPMLLNHHHRRRRPRRRVPAVAPGAFVPGPPRRQLRRRGGIAACHADLCTAIRCGRYARMPHVM